jgi:hypothetical protein
MTHKTGPQIFLAYSAHDRAWAEQFNDALREAGIHAWFDYVEILPGDAWKERIETALRESETLVFILTPSSVSDPWTLFELGAAVGGHKRIIPVVAKEFDRRSMPPLIGRYQFLEAASAKEAARRVAETLAAAA